MRKRKPVPAGRQQAPRRGAKKPRKVTKTPTALARAARQRYALQQKRSIAARKGWATRNREDTQGAWMLVETTRMRAFAAGTELDVFANLRDLADANAERIARRTGLKLRDVYSLYLSPDASRIRWPWVGFHAMGSDDPRLSAIR